MIGAFWNVRGLGQTGKIQCLGDFISENHVDLVCFCETKREQIDAHILGSISGRVEFKWHSLPAVNTAGGILVGLKVDLFEIIGFVDKKFCVIVTIKNKSDGFMWHLVAVYGTAYNEFKVEFIAELHEVMSGLTHPVLLGGDFNLVRSADDKNNGNINN
jgi:exonuclease III